MRDRSFRVSVAIVVSTILLAGLAGCKTSAPEPPATLAPVDTASIPATVALVAAPASAPTTSAPASASAETVQFERRIKEPIRATTSSTQTVTVGDLATQQVKVVIPVGAVPAGIAVTVRNPEKVPPMDPKQGTLLAAPVEISIGDGQIRLETLSAITFGFDPAKLPPDTDSSTLWPAFYDSTNKKWEMFLPQKVDMKAGTLSFTTSHFSLFGWGKVPESEVIDKYIHNKAVAEVAQAEIVNKVVTQILDKSVDHLLKDGLGLKDDSTRSKVYSSLLKDDEWGEIATRGATVLGAGKDASADDVVELTRSINGLVAKKMVENIPEGQLADALTKLSPDKFAQYKEEGASQGLENAINWTNAGSRAAGYLAEKRYTDAARIIGEQIADGVPLVKATKAGAAIVEYGRNVWKNAEIEAAYKTFKNGASVNNIFWGFGKNKEIEPGKFDGVWDQMGGARQQVEIDAVKAEEDARHEDGSLPLGQKISEAEAQRIKDKARDDLNAQFKIRAGQDAEIAKREADLKDLASKFKTKGLLDSASAYSFPTGADTVSGRLETVMRFRGMILADIWGSKGKPLTNQDIADLTATRLSAKGPEGVKLYLAELKKKFGIDRYARYGLAAAVTPTKAATPSTALTPASAAAATPRLTSTPDLRGSWTRISRSESSRRNDLGYTNAVFAGNSVTLTAGRSSDHAAKWTCSWPEPPASLAPGKAWIGGVSVKDAGSKYIAEEPSLARLDFTATYSYGGSAVIPSKSATALVNVPAKAEDAANGSFEWALPGNEANGTQIFVTAQCNLGHGTGIGATVQYKYELRK